jgi:putative hydrolase of the HAD superfamily
VLSVEAVILDVGGVLLVPHHEVVGAALGMALDAAIAERAHYRGAWALDLAEDGRSAENAAYLRAYAEAVGIPAHDVEAAMARMWELWGGPSLPLWRQQVAGSRDGLRTLAGTGRKLGIVSNADGSIEEQLRVNEICQVGEGLGVPVLAIIDSTVVGVSKPSADIFRHALEPLQVEPRKAIYVGDTVTYDVRGARAAGLTPVHFDPLSLCAQREDHAHVVSLSAVGELLESA